MDEEYLLGPLLGAQSFGEENSSGRLSVDCRLVESVNPHCVWHARMGEGHEMMRTK